MNTHEPKIIAVSGKGGVGKTSLAALTVALLHKEAPGAKILAIDADPAVGLSTALGVEVRTTLDDIRKLFIEKLEGGIGKQPPEIINDLRYELLSAIEEKDGFAFLAIGRPESSGCYCKVNSFLKDIISLLANEFDYVVIDGEAGIEQVNRRVIDTVTHLVLISDTSKKGTQVIQAIHKVAHGLGMSPAAGALINRVQSPDIQKYVDTGSIPILAFVPEEAALGELDAKGESVLLLPQDSAVFTALRQGLEKLGVLPS